MTIRASAPANSRALLRRRWPRLEVHGTLSAEIAELDLVMPVRDISVGGLAVEAPLRFAPGEIYSLQLTLTGGHGAVRVRARTAYCHARRNSEDQFIAGWEALGDPDTSRAMTALVDHYLALAASDPVVTDGHGERR